MHINNNNGGQEVMSLISLSSDTNGGTKSVSIAQTKNIWSVMPDEHNVIIFYSLNGSLNMNAKLGNASSFHKFLLLKLSFPF